MRVAAGGRCRLKENDFSWDHIPRLRGGSQLEGTIKDTREGELAPRRVSTGGKGQDLWPEDRISPRLGAAPGTATGRGTG